MKEEIKVGDWIKVEETDYIGSLRQKLLSKVFKVVEVYKENGHFGIRIGCDFMRGILPLISSEDKFRKATYDELAKDEVFVRDYLTPSTRYTLRGFFVDELKSYVDFLPTKIVFNRKKGRTTLLFGEAPYADGCVFTSQTSGSDRFDFERGFSIAYYKFINSNLSKDELQKRIENNYNLKHYFQIILVEFLLNKGMSYRQIEKFGKLEAQKSVTFNIKGIEHKIEVEVK
jgi:hypothetical protein